MCLTNTNVHMMENLGHQHYKYQCIYIYINIESIVNSMMNSMNTKNKSTFFKSRPKHVSPSNILVVNTTMLSALVLLHTTIPSPNINIQNPQHPQYVKTDEDTFINTKLIRWSKEDSNDCNQGKSWRICMKNSGCAYDAEFFHVSESLNPDSYHVLDKMFHEE